MKIEEMKSVKAVYEVIQNIDTALAQTEQMQDRILLEPKPMHDGGLKSSVSSGEMTTGYHGRVRFQGCYVGDEMVEAMRDVLLRKRRECIAYCQAYGIEFDDEFIFAWEDEKPSFNGVNCVTPKPGIYGAGHVLRITHVDDESKANPRVSCEGGPISGGYNWNDLIPLVHPDEETYDYGPVYQPE